MMNKFLCSVILLLLLAPLLAKAQSVTYPYPVHYITLSIERQPVQMAYMDAKPEKPNGETVVLFHGKNFNGYYWKDVIAFLTANGYRVIVPDQVGWGKSDKPDIHYSFHLLAYNTKKLLDSLGIKKVNAIAHSMGGMLATRFVLMYPEMIHKLIYENPIGLEDYKTFVPYQTIEQQYEKERKADYASLKKYQQSYYPQWKPEYEQYVAAQAGVLNRPDSLQAAWANAVTYQMIYEQPVLYEFKYIQTPTLMLIGQEDRTIVGKGLLSKEAMAQHGQYPALGRWFHQQIKNSKLVELKGVGHIPHVQVPGVFQKEVLPFLGGK
jgi:pimeloyl-ACP methyl ester carboxylesterase